MSNSLKNLEKSVDALVKALAPEYEFSVVEVNEMDEDIGQDYDEVVIQCDDARYVGTMNEIVYYIHCTEDVLSVTMDICVDEAELFDINNPDWNDIAGLANQVKAYFESRKSM